MMDLLYNKNVELDSDIYLYAIRGGQIQVLKWLKEKGVTMKQFSQNRFFSEALFYQHYDTIVWLLEENCEYVEGSIDSLILRFINQNIFYYYLKKFSSFCSDDITTQVVQYIDSLEYNINVIIDKDLLCSSILEMVKNYI
jgi:hypothetical protein